MLQPYVFGVEPCLSPVLQTVMPSETDEDHVCSSQHHVSKRRRVFSKASSSMFGHGGIQRKTGLMASLQGHHAPHLFKQHNMWDLYTMEGAI